METIVGIAQVVAVLVAIGVVLSSAKGLRDQLWLQTFSEYTRRYSEIMESLPFQARRPGGDFNVETLPRDEQERFLATVRNYLNLCSEEFYLHSKKHIDDKTWKVWESGIREVVRFPCFGYGWRVLRCEYEYHAEFCSFMDALIGDRSDAA